MATTALSSRRSGWVLLFLLLFGALTMVWSSDAVATFQDWFIQYFTVLPAVWLIALVDPARGIMAAGAQLAAPGGSLNVRAGCEGADMAFLLLSAMLCAPLSWRSRLAGLLLGLAFVFVLNQARVVALFYALQHDRALFDLLHGTLLPLLLVVLISAFFVWWLGRWGTPLSAATAGGTP